MAAVLSTVGMLASKAETATLASLMIETLLLCRTSLSEAATSVAALIPVLMIGVDSIPSTADTLVFEAVVETSLFLL